MNKPIIGIITPRKTDDKNIWENYIKFSSCFPKKILKAGGIPVGILFPNGKFIKQHVDICDGFLLQGGSIIESAQVNVIHYALEKKKPILGICLGMQTIAAYEWFKCELGDTITSKIIDKTFKPEFEQFFLKLKKGHNYDPNTFDELSSAKHTVTFERGTKAYEIFGRQTKMPSIHNFIVNEEVFKDSNQFIISGRSSDHSPEAIETKEDEPWIVGLQFHPELEDNIEPFKMLVKKASEGIR